MSATESFIVDALVPARAGSEGLPGKNMRLLGDQPLFLHSVECAKRVPSVRRVLVSTDDQELASVAVEHDCFVPGLRPAELARASSPMSDVVNYAASLMNVQPDESPDALLLLDPTSPLREPNSVEDAIGLLAEDSSLDGVISISTPSFNPMWVGVQVTSNGSVTRHPIARSGYFRRQDVPPFWRINGSFYVWRIPFALSLSINWLDEGKHGKIETPELLSHSIDTEEDFRLVESLIASGIIRLPWFAR